jgi:diguanylate cyclase
MDASGAALTLLTYSQFQHALRIEFGRARRHGFPLSCVILTPDGIDAIRECHGVAARDQVLSRWITRLKSQARASDLLGHYQDRLALLLPHAPIDGARAVAERFIEVVRGERFTFGGTPRTLTASAGVALLESRTTLFFDSLFKAAEAALGQAVAAGGNRVVVGDARVASS